MSEREAKQASGSQNIQVRAKIGKQEPEHTSKSQKSQEPEWTNMRQETRETTRKESHTTNS